MLFLDMQLIKHPDRTLGTTVYWKPTHTNLYINNLSHHHPVQKTSFMTTLLYKVNGIASAEHLPRELAFLKEIFMHNGFTRQEVEYIIANHGKQKLDQSEE